MTRLDVNKLPVIAELPDPFLLADGSRVKTPADWPRRRAELLELIQAYEYGHLPPAPPRGAVKATLDPKYEPPARSGTNADPLPASVAATPLPPGATQEKYLLTVQASAMAKPVVFHVIVTAPAGKGPFPAIVNGDLCWGPVQNQTAAEVAARGYMLAQFDRTEIAADKAGPREGGLYAAYPGGDFSALAAWAWGYHRVIDYLLSRPDVDASKIVVTGHSRGGKATLLAGATDERIALTVPNNSGCGGAGSYRFQAPKSEDIGAIVKRFPHWFRADFGDFIGKVDRLPFDQHSVRALIAPRALLTCEATDDLWSNPQGTQQSYLAARTVFEFLGAGDKTSIHYRPGKHAQNFEDWQTLLDFADKLFFNKATQRKFGQLAYPQTPGAWSWTAPK